MAKSKTSEELMKNIRNRIDKAFDRATGASELKVEAKEAERSVKTRTRSGYGVKDWGESKYQFKAEAPLKPSTIKQRAKDPNLHPQTTPTRNNLTRTGQLIDAVIGSSGDKKIIIELKDQRTDSDKGNNEIAGYQALAGRSFLDLSDLEIERLRRSIIARIKKALKLDQ